MMFDIDHQMQWLEQINVQSRVALSIAGRAGAAR